MKLWNKKSGILLVLTLLIFSGFGIFSCASVPNEPTCLFSAVESMNCASGESQSVHVMKHCLNFFVGVMQTSEGLDKFLFTLLFVATVFFKVVSFRYLLSPALIRLKQYSLRSVHLSTQLMSHLREVFSWSAFTYSYSR